MALCQSAVNKAFEILTHINDGFGGYDIATVHEWQEGVSINKLGIILVLGRVGDGWENIFMNVKDITPAQKRYFNEHKGEVPNTSFTENVPDILMVGTVTRIGWF